MKSYYLYIIEERRTSKDDIILEENKNMARKKIRIITTKIKDKNYIKNNLLHELSVQLSDGYWENDEGFYEEFWNWLSFEVVHNFLTIKIKGTPTWSGVKDIFSKKTDEDVINYIGNVLEDCYDLAPFLFEKFVDEKTIKDFIKELVEYCDDAISNIEKEDIIVAELFLKDLNEKSECNEIKTLKKIVKKQNSKKIIKICNSENTDIKITYGHCPGCNCVLNNVQHINFCGTCGQKINWN